MSDRSPEQRIQSALSQNTAVSVGLVVVILTGVVGMVKWVATLEADRNADLRWQEKLELDLESLRTGIDEDLGDMERGIDEQLQQIRLNTLDRVTKTQIRHLFERMGDLNQDIGFKAPEVR